MRTAFTVCDYDLDATLDSGQAFRWQKREGGWEGIIGARWVRLCSGKGQILAQTAGSVNEWSWLEQYLQLHTALPGILATFPVDQPMQTAIQSCHGLRLLKQDPWEALASFICSSNKQIVQIRQIIALLCTRFGEPIQVPKNREPAFAFPTIERLAEASESSLRDCKMGFRAPYLRATAQRLASGEVNLHSLSTLTLEQARAELLQCPGVGPKIADCVLLFGYGFAEAFPVDVWIMKALRQLYFHRRSVKLARLRRFSQTHFGPNSGYAQQYLFHYMRTKEKPGGPVQAEPE